MLDQELTKKSEPVPSEGPSPEELAELNSLNMTTAPATKTVISKPNFLIISFQVYISDKI